MPDLERLRAMGVDTDEGLAFCADDAEFYEEMLTEFLRESDRRTEDLRRFYESENWRDYAICAHSLKSTARMVGLTALSAQARELELAAKADDAETIRRLHDGLTASCAETVRKLAEIVG